MKKIYLSLIAAVSLTTASAQKPSDVQVGEKATVGSRIFEANANYVAAKTSTATVTIQDTLWYFVNKHVYRNTSTNANSYYTYKVAPTYTNANSINSGGAVFLKPNGATGVAVAGAEGIVIKKATSPSANVPVTLYLFNVSAGLPTGAAVASCTTSINSTTVGNYVGCNFGSPAVVVGDYAIVMKNGSANPLDTISLFMNNARTATANISPAGPEQKFGEGMGIFSYGTTFGTNWQTTTDVFTLAAPNTGSDFEFCVAPRVAYTITANSTASTYSTCNTTNVTFINTSSGFFSHRQYNLNKFWKSWAPFSNAAAFATEIPDSVFTWNMGGNPASTVYGSSPLYTYSVMANSTVVSTMIAKFQHMSDYWNYNHLNSPNVVFDSQSWTTTVTVCNVGLTENNIENQFAIYPNPATDKVVVLLNNANTNTQIQVLNALGQVVLTRTNLTEKNELNTESLSKGVYFVRVSSGKESSTSKLIINR